MYAKLFPVFQRDSFQKSHENGGVQWKINEQNLKESQYSIFLNGGFYLKKDMKRLKRMQTNA
mgnify:CR=1 FL=1